LFLETLAINPLSTNKEAVVEACAKKDLTAPACATLTDALQFAMASIIEPGLSKDSIVFVTHYPADQAVFAVLEPTSPNVARRFEAYFGGVELVNGFEELGDARENEQRMKQENVRRQAISKPEIPLDRNFLSSLKNGLPHCSGAALGLDRLVMLALNKTNTGDVIAFHWDLC
jgi:lysyl-tRNA synthetase class 2